VTAFYDDELGLPVLMQVEYGDQPWRLGVACICLYATRRTLVWDGIVAELFRRNPTADSMLKMNDGEACRLLKPLGLAARRVTMIRRFLEDYSAGFPFVECASIGPYARESYRIFSLGLWPDLPPEDAEIRRFWQWHVDRRLRWVPERRGVSTARGGQRREA
jgi:hypothetical protein